MTNKKLCLIVFVSLLLVFSLSLVFALHNPNHNPRQNQYNKFNNLLNDSNFINFSHSTHPRLNYGVCVANHTIEKRECYRNVKKEHEMCMMDVRELIQNLTNNSTNESQINRTYIKDVFKECRDNYKAKLKQCKMKFKENKRSCEKYKCDPRKNKIWINGSCVSV
ncbi:MAG: hypothetical protein QXI33_02140 [Candidatus Pacearchaeota archaeon]